jgi:hypothetical protein
MKVFFASTEGKEKQKRDNGSAITSIGQRQMLGLGGVNNVWKNHACVVCGSFTYLLIFSARKGTKTAIELRHHMIVDWQKVMCFCYFSWTIS